MNLSTKASKNSQNSTPLLKKNYHKKSYHSKASTQSDNLNPWLVTGFTDAEGCFSARIAKNKKKINFI